jgi:hypothetical protein
MGVRAIMGLGGKRVAQAAILTPPVSNAVYPGSYEVGIITVLPTTDYHRLAEVQRAILVCIHKIRDLNFMTPTGTSTTFVTSLNNPRGDFRLLTAVGVIEGHVGLSVHWTVRQLGDINYVENLHKQLLDWMRENNRLVV